MYVTLNEVKRDYELLVAHCKRDTECDHVLPVKTMVLH